jgi:ketosteroid isomerase-like protein
VPRSVLDLVQSGLAALNSGDLEAIYSVVADDVVAVVPEGFANAGSYEGVEGFRKMMGQWLEVWEGFRAEPLELIPVGEDTVVVSVRQTGTGQGSGVAVEAHFAYLFRARDGQLVEWRLCRDTDEALAHAGPK